MLTDTGTGAMPASDQRASCWQTSRTAHSVMGTMRPDSSAAAMNSPGGTSSPPRFQRISASAPAIVPSSTLTFGW